MHSHFSHVLLFVTPWTAAHQAPLSMGFSRQEYQSGLPGPTPGDLPDPRIEPASPALQADSLPPGKPLHRRQFPSNQHSIILSNVHNFINIYTYDLKSI